jgi:hypothetical protein
VGNLLCVCLCQCSPRRGKHAILTFSTIFCIFICSLSTKDSWTPLFKKDPALRFSCDPLLDPPPSVIAFRPKEPLSDAFESVDDLLPDDDEAPIIAFRLAITDMVRFLPLPHFLSLSLPKVRTQCEAALRRQTDQSLWWKVGGAASHHRGRYCIQNVVVCGWRPDWLPKTPQASPSPCPRPAPLPVGSKFTPAKIIPRGQGKWPRAVGLPTRKRLDGIGSTGEASRILESSSLNALRLE